jgi:antibiotic biosynthesis monooxygenase (ABM) superfamily enzyme
MGTDDGRALLLVMIDIDPDHEEEFNRWYEEEHLPDRDGLPGFVSARRFVSHEGGPKYLALYELENVDALDSDEYLRLINPPSEWTQRMEARMTSRLRAVYTELPRYSAVPR